MRARVVHPDGSDQREVAADLVDGPNAWTQFGGWSPDGTTAVVSGAWQSPENARVEEEQKGFHFTKDGWQLDTHLTDLVSGRTHNVTGVERVSFYNGGLFFWPGDPSKLGFTALIDGNSHPFRMDRDGRNKLDLTAGSSKFTYGFSSSRDGTRISYHKNYQIFLADADGTNAVHVPTGQPFNFGPSWSPDGKWVLFVSGEHYNCHPHVVRADGTGLKKLVDRGGYRGVVEFLDVPDFHGGSSDTPVWSADGKQVFYTAKIGSRVELFSAGLDCLAEQLTRSLNGTLHYHPQPSPDGKRLVYGSKRKGVRQLFVMDLSNRTERCITNLTRGHAAMWPHWQPVVSQNAAAEKLQQSERISALTGEAARQLKKMNRLGLMAVASVNLPAESAGACNHFGWPIATMTGDTIVVMHRRIPGHNAKDAGKSDPTMSYGIVLRSEDGGKTWSPPYDLRDSMRSADRNRGGVVPLSHRAKFDKTNKSTAGYKIHLHSIGTTHDGAVVAINNHGVFRSEDAGRTWTHFSTAFRDDNFLHQIVNLGPRIVDHPQHGLTVFGNWFGEANSYHQLSNRLVALSSSDGGATWNVEEHDAQFPQYEPAALFHEGRYLFVTRDQAKVRAHKQMSWSPGAPPEVIDTNLEDPRFVDTVDFCLNPVNQRFEIVRSERHCMELWLWSMDPADWNTGQWRRECRLLAIEGKFYSTADGFHPAGAVLDAKRGVQHIFIYAGHANGPAGIFRITRTLNTPKLVAAFVQGDAASGQPATQAQQNPDCQ
jgi:TolB protein